MKLSSILFLFYSSFAFATGGSFLGGGNTLGLSCSNGQIPEWNGAGFTVCGTASGSGTMIGPGTSVANGISTYSDTGGITMLSPAGFTIASSVMTVANLLDSGLTASEAVYTDSSKNLVSVAVTGTGNAVRSASPTFTGTAAFSAASFSGAVTGIVEQFTGLIPAAADGTYTIDLSPSYAYTINTLKIITDSGTTTAAVQINGTPVTGISAVSVSNSIATGTASAANSVSIGNKVTLVLSSSSTPVNLAFTMKVTR